MQKGRWHPMRGYILMTLVCACLLMSACSGIIMTNNADSRAIPAQSARGLAQAKPSLYPLMSATPSSKPQVTLSPAPLSSQTSLDEIKAAALDPEEEHDEAQAAQGDAEYYIAPELSAAPEIVAKSEAEVFTFIGEGHGASEGGYLHSGQIQSDYAMPLYFEVNDVFANGMPLEALPENERAAVTGAINALGYSSQAISVSVTYKTDTLVSCLLNMGGVTLPVNVSAKTGETVKLSDFFTREDRGWRGLISDIIMSAADRYGLTLLCDVPPVDDAHPCFLLDGNIVLLFRPYEITTYDAGSPCFLLPMHEVIQYTTGAYGIGG